MEIAQATQLKIFERLRPPPTKQSFISVFVYICMYVCMYKRLSSKCSSTSECSVELVRALDGVWYRSEAPKKGLEDDLRHFGGRKHLLLITKLFETHYAMSLRQPILFLY